ncbi:L,D-transpeptidase family protein [bacterium]|nr:L,D-transpeptidase family protein [bacterium]
MARTIIILILLLVIIGTLGTASFLYYQRSINEEGWNQVYMAESRIESEEYDKAIKTLLPIVNKGKRFEGAAQAMYNLARAYEGAGVDEAADMWKQLVEEFPESPYYHEAKLKRAWGVMETKPDEAKAIFAEVIEGASPEIRIEAKYGMAMFHEKEQDVEAAKDLYYEIIANDDLPWKLESQIKDRLTELNNQTLWRPMLDEFSKLYTVQPGDAPITVGQKFKTTAWYILEANGLNKMLHPGKRLKVPKEPFRVLVNKKRCRLELLNESGTFIKWYPCGVGKLSYKTPPGEYKIENKEQNPVWYPPTGGIVNPGDPENALGTRWMGIGNSLGIHGTNEPDSIGKPESEGCIRMHNKDVEELYKLITYDTRVTIIEGE